MSPVHASCVFVHPIYAWKQIHAWMQIWSEWNGNFMYDQTLGWSYVNTHGIHRCGKERWQESLEWYHVQERILIPCCICSWHAQDPRISTQIALPKPESHGNCSHVKAFCADRIWGRRQGQHCRIWENYCWLNNHSIFSSYNGSAACGLTVKSLHAVYLSRI